MDIHTLCPLEVGEQGSGRGELFIGRELCKDEASGEWLMVMRFDNRAHMQDWLAIVKTVPEMRELGGLVESFTSNRFVTHRV